MQRHINSIDLLARYGVRPVARIKYAKSLRPAFSSKKEHPYTHSSMRLEEQCCNNHGCRNCRQPRAYMVELLPLQKTIKGDKQIKYRK